MNRWNRMLLALLAVQVVLVMLALRPESGRDVPEAGPLLPGFRADLVTGLRIYVSPEESTALEKKEGVWTLPAQNGYPADPEKVSALLKKFEKLDTSVLVARTGSSHRRLKVSKNDYNRRVDFDLAEGRTEQLFIGSSPSYRKVHVRRGAGDAIFLTGEIGAWELHSDPSSWFERGYLRFEEASITAVHIENGSGGVRVEKGDDGNWALVGAPAGMRLNGKRWSELLNKVLYVRMNEPAGTEPEPSFGLDEPVLTLTVETGSGTVRLQVGTKNEEKNDYVAKSSASRFYVRVSDYAVDELVRLTSDSLLERIPEDNVTSDRK